MLRSHSRLALVKEVCSCWVGVSSEVSVDGEDVRKQHALTLTLRARSRRLRHEILVPTTQARLSPKIAPQNRLTHLKTVFSKDAKLQNNNTLLGYQHIALNVLVVLSMMALL